jgi:ABC-2 type transport system permease protein
MNATATMIKVELKLASRDIGTAVFGLLFPAALLLVLAALPGFTDPDPDLGGLRLIDIYTPIVLMLTFAIVGVSAVAASLATYRKEGVLRRLRVTPVGPGRLLGAQLIAHLLIALTGSGLAVAVALAVLGVAGPANWIGFVLGLVLAAAALFAIGLVIGSLIASPSAAGAVSVLAWMPLMVLGGLWFPREAMPATMRMVSDFSPVGAAVDIIQHAWFRGVTPTSSMLVLALTVVTLGVVAVVTFRWE